MGLLETIGRIMMKLIPGQQQAMEKAMQNMTLEQIEDLERQGCDMTEYRKAYELRIASEKDKQKALYENSMAALDYNKLANYMTTPRDEQSEFMQDVMKLNTVPLVGKKEFIDKLINAPIVYAAVVQAYHLLYEPGDNSRTGMVLVFTPDPEYATNKEWLRNKANKIMQMKESNQIPQDCVKFINTLRDSQSMFCFRLGESLSEGVETWCVTYTLDKQSHLPLKYIPADRIIPFILQDAPKENYSHHLQLIPAKYYSK